ncbi:Phosphoribosylamine--glycine ligase [uncultured archaeon]|nr:Phosphoribosylamine--glycine ligase [uncultured archaeon]
MTDVVNAIKKETGAPYQGILYGQFMATDNGISVIEFNARFGDPEAMNILPLLENDFLDVCMNIAKGTLNSENIKFAKKATVCKYVVPGGYPENGREGIPIMVGNTGRAHINYAGVYEEGGELYTTGSRAIAVVGIANTIEEAEEIAEEGLSGISSENSDDIYARHDIGTKRLINKRILHMEQVRRLQVKRKKARFSELKNL